MSENCYFFVDMTEDVPEDQRKISVLCIKCREEHFPDTGWFYDGVGCGYGPWDFVCHNCGFKIHEHLIEDERD